MTTPEEILNIAIERLQAGESPKAIASDYPDHSEELMGLLAVTKMGLNIPKLIPPTPYKRHLYAEVTSQSWFWTTFAYYRIAAVPIALLVALIGGRAVVNATETSLPGDTLYSLKRATEEARLTFTRDQEKIASIHVELMQKRMAEVRQAADNGDTTVETAAIAELQSQTTKTFEEAAPLATANAISKQDSSLLDTLLAVNKQQKDILEDLSESNESTDAKTVATTALADNVKNDQTLAKIVATVNDQALMDMPNKVSITGTISNHYNNRITVEKNTFVINDKTTITDSNGEVATTSISELSGRATITGIKAENGILIAKQILILPIETGDVKGVVDVIPVAKPPIKSTEPTIPVTPQTVQPTQNPTEAQGTFIVEPSAPQYYQ